MDSKAKIFEPTAGRAAPLGERGVIYWLKSRLFSGWVNSFFTIAILFVFYKVLPPLINWVFLKANWSGNPDQCMASNEGACWSFIGEKMQVLFMGVYPTEHGWRVAIGAVLLVILSAFTIMDKLKGKRLLIAWFMLPVFGYWLVGGGLGLAKVDQSLWGGLMLSILLAIVGIIISIPIGIMLAVGRFTGTPIIRALSIGTIELIRGVPLITILFMASVMMPLFLPQGFIINNILRIQIGMIIFSAAYIAEVVRGGLQAIPKGQSEAAQALGLGSFTTLYLVILPQALRYVLPPLIGRAIALFKDTSLVIVVGLLDFLGMIKAASLDSEWLGFETEAYVFGAFVYFIICYALSRYGKLLESRGPATR